MLMPRDTSEASNLIKDGVHINSTIAPLPWSDVRLQATWKSRPWVEERGEMKKGEEIGDLAKRRRKGEREKKYRKRLVYGSVLNQQVFLPLLEPVTKEATACWCRVSKFPWLRPRGEICKRRKGRRRNMARKESFPMCSFQVLLIQWTFFDRSWLRGKWGKCILW